MQRTCAPKIPTLFYAVEHVEVREAVRGRRKRHGKGQKRALIQLMTVDCRGGALSYMTSAGAAAGDRSLMTNHNAHPTHTICFQKMKHQHVHEPVHAHTLKYVFLYSLKTTLFPHTDSAHIHVHLKVLCKHTITHIITLIEMHAVFCSGLFCRYSNIPKLLSDSFT